MDTAAVERVYGQYAKVYDHLFGRVFHDGREHAVRRLNLSLGDRVLEVGVGTGLSLPFYPRSCKVVGVDLSEGMLAQCQARVLALRLDHVRLEKMDASAMDFADDSFDAVMAAYVVTAVPDYRVVMQEMIRVCKPGGRIMLLNHFSSGNPVIHTVEKALSPFCKHLGWRTDLSLATVLDGTRLIVLHTQAVNPLRFWRLVTCVNGKASGNGHRA